MKTKELLLPGLFGMFVGMISSEVIIYFLKVNGGEANWLVNHRFYASLLISFMFGLAAVTFYFIKKLK